MACHAQVLGASPPHKSPPPPPCEEAPAHGTDAVTILAWALSRRACLCTHAYLCFCMCMHVWTCIHALVHVCACLEGAVGAQGGVTFTLGRLCRLQ